MSPTAREFTAQMQRVIDEAWAAKDYQKAAAALYLWVKTCPKPAR